MSNELDLLVTWGREFCAAMPDNTEVTGQDAYEAHVEAFDRDPNIAFFRAMGPAEFAALAAAAAEILEDPDVSADQMRGAVERTLSNL